MIGITLEQSGRDIRHSLRTLGRAPAFTATVVLILGLAIGMTSAMFTVFHALLLRELPIREQDRVVTLTGAGKGLAATEFPLLVDQFHRYQDATRALSSVAGYAHFGAYAFPLRDGDRPLDLKVSGVTGNFFDVLGTRPVLGRLLRPDDDRPWGPVDETTGDYNIVISWNTWQSVFGGDSAIIGHRLHAPTIRWEPVIVGVAPPGLDFPRGVDYWIPANYPGLDLIGRLSPGSNIDAARQDYFNFIDTDPGYLELGQHTLTARVDLLTESIVGDVRPALLALTAAVALLLLLACVNIGNLVLVRAAGRVREFSIRRALGAASSRIVRELLAENAVLGIGGGLVGLLLARALLVVLPRIAPDGLPRIDMIGEAGTPFGIAALVTIATLLLFGLLPAIGTLRFDLSSPLRSDERSGTEGRRLRRLRMGLVASQIALALVVLAGAGLLVRSFARLAGMDFGYRTDRLSVMTIALPFDRYLRECNGPASPDDSAATEAVSRCTDQRVFGLHDRIESMFARMPAVAHASSILVQPFLGPSVFMTRVEADHQGQTEGDANPWVAFEAVGPDFFETMGLPLVRGRAFTAADRDGAAGLAIITQGVARALWPGQDALGRRYHPRGNTDPSAEVTIIGIVPDVHYRQHRVTTPTIYRPYRQMMAQGTFIVRTRGSLRTTLPGIQAGLHDIDSALDVSKAETMDELIAPELAEPRLEALLLAAFAITAVVLAAIGLYGIMAQTVAQRRRELGVRMVLGATAAQLRTMMLRQAAIITAIGGVAGLAGALAGSRMLSAVLFRVSPTDPATLLAISLLLAAVALLAAWIPARRATRIDPASALRTQWTNAHHHR